MQIDILIPVRPQEVRHAISTLVSLLENCDVDSRFCVMMHGGPRQAFVELDEFLKPCEHRMDGKKEGDYVMLPFEWTVKHEQRGLSFSGARSHFPSMIKNRLSVLVDPGVTILDKQWFGKMQRPFLMDRTAMVVVMDEFLNSTMNPGRALVGVAVAGPMVMGSVDFQAILEENMAMSPREFGETLLHMVRARGGHRWILNSIWHTLSCPEQSEPQEVQSE